MLDRRPALRHDVGPQFVDVLIDTETDDSDFVAPGGFVLLQHFLIVRHRLLAGRTPGCPEVVQDDLALHVLNVRLSLFEDVACLRNDAYLISNFLYHLICFS